EKRAQHGHDGDERRRAEARTEPEVDDDDAGGDGDPVADDGERPGVAFGGFVDEAAVRADLHLGCPACVDLPDAAVGAPVRQAAAERGQCMRTLPAAASDASHTNTKTIRYGTLMTSPFSDSDVRAASLAVPLIV